MRMPMIFVCLFLWPIFSMASPSDWAKKLCKEHSSKYKCHIIGTLRSSNKQCFTWEEKFRDDRERRIAIAINRRNTLLWRGHVYAIPINWSESYLDHAPFRQQLNVEEPERFVVVGLQQLAWGAYENGKLVNWGPANGGMKRCRETGKFRCKTHPGVWAILRLDGFGKRSNLYPVDCKDKKKCGHLMPYYMPFHHDSTGLHGDKWLVGRNASHGCVRLLTYDARWLSKNFVKVGTKVLVLDY
jgi:hypothetical protein